jgi:hypothetical protein
MLKDLSIDFLSPVPRPAHQGAVAVLLKRADYDPADAEKAKHKRKKRKRPHGCDGLGKSRSDVRVHPHASQLEKFEDDTPAVLTSSVDGHSHLAQLHARSGLTSWQTSEGAESSHDHPFMLVQGADGTFTLQIGDAEGHSHDVDPAILNATLAAAALSKLFDQEDDMPEPKPTTKTADEIASMESNIALARLFIGLNDDERSHFGGLDEVAKVAFIRLDGTGRTAAIEKAKGPDPTVVYKADNGAEYTNADDPRLVTMAKDADEQRARTKKAEDTLTQERLEKRAAEELPNLPGTDTEKAAVLKAIDAIPDEAAKKAAKKLLAAGESAISKAYDTLGTTEVEDELGLEPTSPQGRLDVLTKKVSVEKGISEAAATTVVMATPEGRKLYADIDNENQTRH